jgi:hypothetical protein
MRLLHLLCLVVDWKKMRQSGHDRKIHLHINGLRRRLRSITRPRITLLIWGGTSLVRLLRLLGIIAALTRGRTTWE